MMSRIKNPIRNVVVERAVSQSPLVATLRERLPGISFAFVDTVPEQPQKIPGLLEVVHFKGRFWRSCPGTKTYECCGYQIVHIGTQCSLECTYCILQSYFQNPNLRIFGNIEDLMAEVRQVPASAPHRLFRTGTGEFTDSLLLDPWTGLSRHLVPVFARIPNAVLELKTKTNHVAQLEKLDHGGHSLVSWSLNADEVIRREEPRSAPLEARLEAARRCADWPEFLAEAAGELNEAEQRMLLGALIKMIRHMQERGEIPVARMCVQCRYFRPHVYRDAARPHHCDLVDAPFGDGDLRLDCPDFQPVSGGAAERRRPAKLRGG